MLITKYNKNEGVSLVEILLSTALFVLIVSGIAGSLIYGIQLSFESGYKSQASRLAQEGIQIFRNYRDIDFDSIQDGTYGIEFSGNSYNIVSDGDNNGIYSRTITVLSVDNETKQITSSVSWDQGVRGIKSVEFTGFITNWEIINNDSGMLIYSDNSILGDTVKYRILFDDYSWGPEVSLPNYGAPGNNSVRGIKIYSNPDKNEKILVIKNGESPGLQQNLFAMVWRSSEWGNIVQLTEFSSSRDPWTKSYDGVYLNDGSFLIMYDDNTSIPKYRKWENSSWSDELTTIDITNTTYWTDLQVKPNTNEVMAIIQDSATKTISMYFDGSTWSQFTEHGLSTSSALGKNIGFKWGSVDQDSGILVYNEEEDSLPNFKIWNGSWQATQEPVNLDDTITHSKLAENSVADTYLGCFKDDARDINCLEIDMNGNVTQTTNGEIAKWTHDNYEIPFDVAYESSGSEALIVYANGTGVAQRRISKYRYYNPTTNTWSEEFDGITLGPTEASSMETVRLIPNPDNDYIMVIMSASDQDIWTNVWDGENNTYFSSGNLGPIEQGLHGSFDEDYWFDFAWK